MKDGITARLSLFFRMVDEGVVSFSVAASFLAAVPLCAIQGSWLAEWSFDLFFATWILASLAAYPFVCALLNAYFLAALPVDRERMAASGRMETATIVAGAFGLLCAACLTDSSRMETVSTAGRTFVAPACSRACSGMRRLVSDRNRPRRRVRRLWRRFRL